MERAGSTASDVKVSATSPRPRSRMGALVAKRVEARRKAIAALGPAAVDHLRRLGLDATLIGSAASGRVHEHSDVDILVRGVVTARDRLSAERALRDILSELTIPYDLLFACDLTADQALEFERGRG